ncbi:FumA C-terminus/TtdB family hydratase beta subunit [Candidatus Latescibacterota bacterium]
MENEVIKISTPLDRNILKELHAGDRVSLSGEILVFRDQVHRILCEMIEKSEPLPFDIKDAAVYYCGPTPARHGMPVGSAGPTTSSRMDAFTGPLLEKGLAMTIGKGNRSKEVAELLVKHNAVYMLAIGGTGALLAKHITSSEIIAFPELGPEAARIFTVKDMPLIVGIDMHGKSAFKG